MSRAKDTSRIVKADLALLCAAAIWGSSYSILKIGLMELPMFTLLAARFLLAAALLAVIFRRRLRVINRETVKAGAIIGLFLFGGFAFFSAGLRYTEASRSGFIAGLLVVIVPLLNSALGRRWPKPSVIIGTALATGGLAFLSLRSLSFQSGDLLVLISAFFYALHIVAVGAYTNKMDGPVLVILQLIFGGILFVVLACLFEPVPSTVSPLAIGAVLYLACFASAAALLIQTAAQKYTSSDHAAIIFTFEPVFGAIFAWVFLREVMGGRALLGAAMILAGMLWVEVSGRQENKRGGEKGGESE